MGSPPDALPEFRAGFPAATRWSVHFHDQFAEELVMEMHRPTGTLAQVRF